MATKKTSGKQLADMLYGGDQMRATPQSRITGPIANAVRKAQQFASQYELDPRIPLLGGTGVDELLSLPDAASLLEDVSYNGMGALVRGGNAATGGLGTFRPDPRIMSAADVAATATGVGQLGALAAKAAPGAIKAGARNLSTPRTLNPQAGAIVYHGSPHKFDKFSSQKIGTGEGAQAYGHGLYFAESPQVAKTYQPRSPKFEDKLIKLYQKASSTSNYPMMEVLEDAMLHRTPDEIVQKFTNVEDGYTDQHIKAAQDFANWYSKNEPEVGGLYIVDLPDEKIAQMLDYDKPLGQQPQAVQSWLKNAFNPYRDQLTAKDVGGNEPTGGLILNRLQELMSEGKKADVFTSAENPGARNASQELFDAGIPGIRYLDEQSRGSKGAGGTTNYVVFPGEEDALTIVDRKARGGPVHFSDNPDVMQLELQAGGLVKGIKAAAKAMKGTQNVLPAAEREANLAKMLEDSAVKGRLYHGTGKDIQKFDKSKLRRTAFGEGFHLAESPNLATFYANQFDEGQNVMPVYAAIKNPYDLKNMHDWYDIPGVNDKEKTNFLKSQGYDGIKYPHGAGGDKTSPSPNVYVAFEPEQIKSATGNRGTYDINNPDLNKAKGGAVRKAAGGEITADDLILEERKL
jgi:hypothetical protein